MSDGASDSQQPGAADPQGSDEARLAALGILRVRAENPGPLTLSGTNTWVLGERPAWVIDPGPALPEHLQRLFAAIEQRGGLGGIALTHDHRDHSEAVAALREAYPAPLAAGRGDVDLKLTEDARFGPLQAVCSPGHAPDHFALVGNGACFTGDAVLGNGSVMIVPDPGAMAGYLRALDRLRRRSDFTVLCPGHGEPVWEARAKLEDYIAHRLDRERRLLAALDDGLRGADQLLDAVWPEVPAMLRPAAALTLAAHLDKLAQDGVLPAGVQRPAPELRES